MSFPRLCASDDEVIHGYDWFVASSLLHPICVGSATLVVVFAYLRLASNRTLAPTTVQSWIGVVSLGSTVSRIITGPDLSYVQGLLSLFIIVFFEFVSTFLASHVEKTSIIITSPPVLLAFRGEIDWKMCRRNRISSNGMLMMLRQRGFHKMDQIEAVVLEATGQFSIIGRLPDGDPADEILMTVPGYPEKIKAWTSPPKAAAA